MLSRRPLGRLPPWEGVGLLSAGQPCAAQVMGKVLQDFSPRGPGAAPRTSPFGGLGCPLGSYRMPVEPSPYHGGNLSRGLEEAERCVWPGGSWEAREATGPSPPPGLGGSEADGPLLALGASHVAPSRDRLLWWRCVTAL